MRVWADTGVQEQEQEQEQMAITHNILKAILTAEIHPFVVSAILYDHHVEDRLDMLTDVERLFEDQYHHALFIQCDVESQVVTYEVESVGICVSCEYTPQGY